MNDLGPISNFVHSLPTLRLVPGRCPLCAGAWHLFVFVDGNHPERGSDNSFLLEPFPEDSARPPR